MSKYSAEIKLAACQEYLSGKLSHREICEKYGIYYNSKKRNSMLNQWMPRYLAHGENAFIEHNGNDGFTASFKEEVVKDYLSGGGSYGDIAVKYNIRGRDTVRRWVLLYNANIELKDYDPKREVYMAKAKRKTTVEERKEIVEYCIAHGKDYKRTAVLYKVSYNQVYSWVRKYLSKGEDALLDKRGHHKTDDEVDELERLRRENIRLKWQLEEQSRTVELLKKVKEFERR